MPTTVLQHIDFYTISWFLRVQVTLHMQVEAGHDIPIFLGDDLPDNNVVVVGVDESTGWK
jgi:hypothetical protein